MVLAMAMSRFVCPSVCHKSDFCENDCTDRAHFGIGATLDLSYTVLEGNSDKEEYFPLKLSLKLWT